MARVQPPLGGNETTAVKRLTMKAQWFSAHEAFQVHQKGPFHEIDRAAGSTPPRDLTADQRTPITRIQWLGGILEKVFRALKEVPMPEAAVETFNALAE